MTAGLFAHLYQILVASHTWRVCINGNSPLLWCAVLNDTSLYTCAYIIPESPVWRRMCHYLILPALCVCIQPVKNRISSHHTACDITQTASCQGGTLCSIQYLVSCMCIWVHTRVLIIVPLILNIRIISFAKPIKFQKQNRECVSPLLDKCQLFRFLPFLTLYIHVKLSTCKQQSLSFRKIISTQYIIVILDST